jgi:preprotein translocase subunit SecG
LNTVLLIIHLFVTIALIGVVLIQRSEGGGLGIGTSQGMGSFMSGRGTANLLTRTTAVLAAIFMSLSLTLALLNRGASGPTGSILDTAPPVQTSTPAPAPTPPPAPSGPSAPTN